MMDLVAGIIIVFLLLVIVGSILLVCYPIIRFIEWVCEKFKGKDNE